MGRKLVVVGVLYLASVAAAGVLESRTDDKGKEPEKKPNIVKDYVCLRDGELCHPDFARNRGLYVSCSNAVAWEQQCPKCTYHPLNCPTRTLWFDGEKCDWASPKLASQPCIDRFPAQEINYEKDGSVLSEQESLLQSLQASPMSIQVGGNPMKEPVDKNKWQGNNIPAPFFKSPKASEFENEAEQTFEVPVFTEPEYVKDTKAAQDDVSVEEEDEEEESLNKNERKAEDESEFPTYLKPEDSLMGSKIVRLSDPVYTLVNNPDGSGKQVLMRVAQPFVLEDPARAFLPNLNVISSFSDKE